jgi:predicted lipoprotein with Yx(FWY)xxD motif
MKIPLATSTSVFALLVLTFASSCSKTSSYNTSSGNNPGVADIVLTNNAIFGNIITDKNGRSLYFYFNDAGTTSNCTTGCETAWPAFLALNPGVSPGLNESDFGTITRADGSMQTTYKGWPLYYFAGDSKVADVNGDKVDSLWAVAKPDYTVMVANAQLIGLDGVDYNEQSVAGAGISQFITDDHGRTLYLFSGDASKQNRFTNSDFSNNALWPIDEVSSIGSVPSVLDRSQFSSINVFGRTQLSCKDHPLYYFGQDNSKKGSTKGVSFPTPGAALWKVINSSTPVLQ